MSYSYTQRKKAKKRQRSLEERSLASRLRKGTMPKLFFSRGQDGEMERFDKKVGRWIKKTLTWRTESTYNALTKDVKKNA